MLIYLFIGVMVERSDRMWSTGEGNGKPLQYSCLENPKNSMKRQKDRTLKDELPRSVGAQYATGSWLIWKDPNVEKDWRQEEKGTTEYEMVGWHHRLNGHEFGWTPGAGDGQKGLVCCGSWGCKESDTTERLNWTDMNFYSTDFFKVSSIFSHIFSIS